MKHLMVDEIIDFVSFHKLDDESLALATKVNAHIFECNTCRKKVEAFQLIYDELIRMGRKDDLQTLIYKEFTDLKEETNKTHNQLDDYM